MKFTGDREGAKTPGGHRVVGRLPNSQEKPISKVPDGQEGAEFSGSRAARRPPSDGKSPSLGERSWMDLYFSNYLRYKCEA